MDHPSRAPRAFDRVFGLRAPGAIYGLLALDLAALAWVIAESFLDRTRMVVAVDLAFGIVLGTELLLRLRASRRPWRDLAHPTGIADVVAVLSFLAAPFVEGWGFLRALRTLRLLRSARLLARLRHDFGLVRRNEEAVVAGSDLVVFVVFMTGLVFATQQARNPEIANWADALYFTVTALTTTGFGDITLDDTWGRLLSVVIMLSGVTLFLRLAHALFRPSKVRFRCGACGLGRHEPDAVHCKACGTLLNIPDDGD